MREREKELEGKREVRKKSGCLCVCARAQAHMGQAGAVSTNYPKNKRFERQLFPTFHVSGIFNVKHP